MIAPISVGISHIVQLTWPSPDPPGWRKTRLRGYWRRARCTPRSRTGKVGPSRTVEARRRSVRSEMNRMVKPTSDTHQPATRSQEPVHNAPPLLEKGLRRGPFLVLAPDRSPTRPMKAAIGAFHERRCLNRQEVAKSGKLNRGRAGWSDIRRGGKWLDTLPLVAGRGAAWLAR